MNKYKKFLWLLVVELLFSCNAALASNASYIALSSQIARKTQLDVVANNLANAATTGYEQDDVLFRKANNGKSKNSFVITESTYKSGGAGAIKVTNRPTDIAVSGDGYLKVATPRGIRYTLDGAMVINNQNSLVNSDGYPYLSKEGNIIELPDSYQNLQIASDGSVFVDGQNVGQIGVFGFENKNALVKDGGNLYKTSESEIALEEYSIASGALRTSNVNSAGAMAKMIEMQRSFGMATNVVSDLADLERAVISKLSK